jgi:ribokinase
MKTDRQNHLRPAKPAILVVGSSNTDLIIKAERIPKPGETILGGEFTQAAGGKGANQAVAAARAGGAVTFVARIGRDANGAAALAGFAADGINVKYVFCDPTRPSGVALILVDQLGENSIAVASGANDALSPSDLRAAKNAFSGAQVMLLQLESPLPTVVTAAKLAASQDIRVILNPAPARMLPAGLLKLVYVLTPNETEAELLTGVAVTDVTAASAAADKLLSRGVLNVVITMGARGAFVAGTNGRELIPGFKANAVDATGAGDVFNGAIAVALAQGRTLAEAARFANAAAAISVTRLGAQPSAPSREEIELLLTTGKFPGARKSPTASQAPQRKIHPTASAKVRTPAGKLNRTK